MSVDRQRIAAVQKLQELGYGFTADGQWLPPITNSRGDHLMAMCEAISALQRAIKNAGALDGATSITMSREDLRHVEVAFRQSPVWIQAKFETDGSLATILCGVKLTADK